MQVSFSFFSATTTNTVFLLCNTTTTTTTTTTTSTVLWLRNFRGVYEGAGESPESDVSGTLFETIFTLDFATVAICF